MLFLKNEIVFHLICGVYGCSRVIECRPLGTRILLTAPF